MGEVVDHVVMDYLRGKRMFEQGAPCPPKPSDECSPTETQSLLWIGYRVAKGVDWLKRRDIARTLDMPDPEWRE